MLHPIGFPRIIQISVIALFTYRATILADRDENPAVDSGIIYSQRRGSYRINFTKTSDSSHTSENLFHHSRYWHRSARDKHDLIKENECQISSLDRTIWQKLQDGSISKPIYKNGVFANPWETWRPPFIMEGKIQYSSLPLLISNDSLVPLYREVLDVQKPDLSKPPTNGKFKVTWIGHSTLLIQVDGYNILTDPIFSKRASPVPFVGPVRFQEPALKISELPPIDIVVLSHNHFDHLDRESIEALNDRFGSECRWLVPLGVGDLLRTFSIKNYYEFDWWKKDCYPVALKSEKSSSDSGETVENSINRKDKILEELPQGQLQIYSTPAQHWSRRTLNDFCKTLWSSYTFISSSNQKFFFAGDTAYCPAFKEIFEIFGPMNGAAIPIGAYGPRWISKSIHVDPAGAIKIHRDLKCQKSMAIHWGTFKLSLEPYMEPAQLLQQIMSDENHSNDRPFTTVKHGASMTFCSSEQDC